MIALPRQHAAFQRAGLAAPDPSVLADALVAPEDRPRLQCIANMPNANSKIYKDPIQPEKEEKAGKKKGGKKKGGKKKAGGKKKKKKKK